MNNTNHDDLFKREGKTKSQLIGARSFRCWQNSVGRLNVFTDSHLSAGEPVNGHISINVRLDVYKTLKGFLKRYKDIEKEEFRPFTYRQENEMMRVIAGGLVG